MIQIKGSTVQFKNPEVGQPTRRVVHHFYARNIMAIIDGEERMFRFNNTELPLEATEEDMIAAIQSQLDAEKQNIEVEENAAE